MTASTALPSLLLVGEVCGCGAAVPVVVIVRSRLAVLERRENGGLRVELNDGREPAVKVGRAGARLRVLVESHAVLREVVPSPRRFHARHERDPRLPAEARPEGRGPEAKQRGELGVREAVRLRHDLGLFLGRR